MKHRTRLQWVEIAAGIALLAAGAFFRQDPSSTVNVKLTIALFALTFSALSLSSALIDRRWARLILKWLGAVGLGYAALVAFWRHQADLYLLFAAFAAALLLEEDGGITVKEAAAQGLGNVFAFFCGAYFLLTGLAAAVQGIIPGWFTGDAWFAAIFPGAYLIRALVMLMIGAWLVVSSAETRVGKPQKKRACAAGIFLFLFMAAASAAAGGSVPAAVFAATGVLLGVSCQLGDIRFEPEGLAHATPEQKAVYRYLKALRIALWTVFAAMSIGIPFVGGLNQGLFFLSMAVMAVNSYALFSAVPIGAYTRRTYVLAVVGFTAAFLLLVFSAGGLHGPLAPYAFIVLFAAAVVVDPRWVIVEALSIWGVFTASYIERTVLGRNAGGATFVDYAAFSVSVFIFAFYAYVVGRDRQNEERRLLDVNRRNKEALERVEKESEKVAEEKRKYVEANKDLTETRTALMNVLDDVEESKRQIELDHLRESAVVRALGEGVIAADKNGRVILYNPAAEAITGVAETAAIGQPIDKVLKLYREGEDVLRTDAVAKAYQGQEGELGSGLEVRRHDGKRTPVAGSVRPFFGQDEVLMGIALALRDVTIEREVDRQKSSFISVASHQLRTPLSAMRWCMDLLLAGDVGRLTARQKEFVGDMQASVVRLTTLVSDLLQVSRAEEGRLSPQPRATDLSALIEGELKVVAPIVREKGLKVEKHFPKEPSMAMIDPHLIGQVMANLIGNAVKYTPDKSVVGVRVSLQNDDMIRVEIWDSGSGISAQDRKHVFEKFYRGKDAVRMETVGTGLGLYIAKTIVDASKGKIWFEDVEGGGTRFSVTLPAVKGKGTL